MITSSKEIFSGIVLGFDTGVAKLVGVEAATVFNHIVYWLKYNADRNTDRIVDGKIWMYETQKQMAEFFEFLNEDQISRAITKLVEKGLLIKANYNKNKFDKTSWYTVFDQSMIQKKFTKPQNCGIDNVNLRNPNRKSADCIYTEEHTEEYKKEQQQQKPPTPKVDASKMSHNAAVSFYECLRKIDIPESEKIWISKTYDIKTVEHAITYATHPMTKIDTTLVRTIKWACRYKPTLPQKPEEIVSSNKELAKKLESTLKLPATVRFEVLNKYVEIGYKCGQNAPTVIEYSIAAFKDLLDKALQNYGLQQPKLAT